MTEHKHRFVVIHFAILELGYTDYLVARVICEQEGCEYESYKIGEAVEENYEV